MALTAVTRTAWDEFVSVEAERHDPTRYFEGDHRSGYPIEYRDTTAGEGDSISSQYQPIDTTGIWPEVGSTPSSAASGASEVYNQSIAVDYFSLEGGVPNLLESQQRSPYDVAETEHNRVHREWSEICARWKMNHLAGDTLVNTVADHAASAGMPVLAYPTSENNVMYAEGASVHTTPAGVGDDSTAILTTELIDEFEAKASEGGTFDHPIPKARTPMGDYWVLMTSQKGAAQIRSNSSATNFQPIALRQIEASGSKTNPFNEGKAFIYGSTIIVPNPFMPTGALDDYTAAATDYQANTSVSVFMGPCALKVIMGASFSRTRKVSYVSDTRFRKFTFIEDTIMGMQRSQPNGKEWSSVLVVHSNSYRA